MIRALRASAVLPMLLALAFALWRALAGDPVTNGLEDRLNDLRFVLRGPRPAPDSVVLVAIDEATVDQYGWSPPPREMFARLIGAVLAARPAVLAIDMLFIDATDHDAALAAVLAGSDGRVILGTAASFSGPPAGPRAPALQDALARSALTVVGAAPVGDPAPRLFAPNDAFLPGVTLGQVNLIRQADAAARRAPLAGWVGGDIYLPSLSLAAAGRLRGLKGGGIVLRPGRSLDFGGQSLATDRGGTVLINPYGGPGAIRTISARDLLDGKVPPNAFEGRAVFLGVTAESLSDLFATPFAASVPGAEVLATFATNIATGALMVQDVRTRTADVALALLLALGLGFASGASRLWLAAAGALAVWLVGALALQLPFAAANIVLDGPSTIFALAAATAWGFSRRMLRERQRSAELAMQRANLSRYVPQVLAEGLARSATPDFDGRTQLATVLFVDVAGYTTISELLSPAEADELTRALHRFYEGCATRHRGVVLNFMGDGALIAFGLPEVTAADAAQALGCGRALLSGVGALRPASLPGEALRLRVSVHSGPVVAGLAGSDRQAQVTMTGDTVNVASRLQEVAKAHGVLFVVSRAVIDAARPAEEAATDGFGLLATVPIRGRVAPIEVWALQG